MTKTMNNPVIDILKARDQLDGKRLINELQSVLTNEMHQFGQILANISHDDIKPWEKLNKFKTLHQKLIDQEDKTFILIRQIIARATKLEYFEKENQLKFVIRNYFTKHERIDRVEQAVRDYFRKHGDDHEQKPYLDELQTLISDFKKRAQDNKQTLIEIKKHWDEKIAQEIIIDEILAKFAKEQSVIYKWPFHDDKRLWKKGDIITQDKLHIEEPNIRVMEKVVMIYTIKELDLNNRIILLDAKITIKTGHMEEIFPLIIHGFATNEEVDNFYLDYFLDSYHDTLPISNQDKYIYDFKIDQLIIPSTVGLKTFAQSHGVVLIYRIISINYEHMTMEVLITASKNQITRSKLIVVGNFENSYDYWLNIKSKIKSIAQSINLKNAVSNNNTWLDLIEEVKKVLIFAKEYNASMIDFINWKAVEHRPLDTILKDDFVWETSTKKAIKYYLFKEEDGGTETFYFHNLKLTKGNNFEQEIKMDDMEKFTVGPTNSTEKKQIHQTLLQNFSTKFGNWQNFIAEYKTVKIKDVKLDLSMQGPTRIHQKSLDKNVELNQLVLNEKIQLFKDGVDLYIHQHIFALSFLLSINAQDELEIVFIFEGTNVNQVEKTIASISNGKVIFVSN